jgi:hypothetical protein
MPRYCLFLVAALVLYAANFSSATIFDWNNTAGGTYSTAANWTPSGPPNSSDTARFNLNNTYAITVASTTGVNPLIKVHGDDTLYVSNSYSA